MFMHMEQQNVLATIISLAQTAFGLKADELDPEINILELGLDSLMIIKLAQEIERRFGVALEARWFLTTMPSLSSLAQHVREKMPAPEKTLPVVAAGGGKTTGAPAASMTPKDFPPPSAAPAGSSPSALPALFAAQLQTMQELFAQQLRALGSAPALSSASSPLPSAPSPTPAGSVRLERNVRGFVLERQALTPEQEAFVARLVAAHTARTAKSRELGRRSAVLADWKSSLSFRPELRETAYAVAAATTFGGRFVDVDGNEYIDIALGMGVHYLGHNPPYVVAALQSRLPRGFGLGPQCDMTAEAAQRISRLTGMERVCFCNTGSEAVMFALRLARARRGRDLIALFNGSYHGTFDGVLAASEEQGTGTYSRGTPSNMVADVLVLDYNAESAFEQLQERCDDIAAVLVEPVQSRRPGLQPQTFLRRLRRFTREKGICLIFDEMVNGFRIAPGGAQEHFSIRADIALYGKVVGGGLPVGVIAGGKEYLDYIDGGFLGTEDHPAADKTIVFGGTFCRHPLSMEAVCAATGHLLEQGPQLQRRMNGLTDRLADRLNLWFQDQAVPLRLMNFGPQFLFEGFGPYSAFAQPIELALFYLLLMERGVYTWERRTCGLCTEHTEDDIRRIEAAVRDSVNALRKGGFPFRLEKGTPTFFCPLSPTQERLYAIFQRDHGQDAYHLPLAWKIRGGERRLDTEQLEICLGECIKRHEALRTSFQQIDGRLVCKIVAEPPFALERIEDPGGRSVEELLAAFIRPFDLEKAPLLRAAVADLDDGHLFLLDLLHIVADGASLGILLDDLNALMNGREPVSNPLSPRHLDTAVAAQEIQADVAYWREQLADLPPLELPVDFPARSGSPVGRQEWFAVEAPLVAQARQACRSLGVTLNMFLNGVYALLLHKLSGATRICVGMADGGRHSEEAAGVMGMFVNTVPQDFRIAPELSLGQFFAGVREACAASMARNRAPYGDIVQVLGRSPAATMLSYEKGDQRRPDWPGLEIEPLAFPGRGAMYDFAIDIVELDGVLHCNLISSEALRPETARAFGECFAHLVEAVCAAAADSQATVRGIDPMPARQRERILAYGKGPVLPFDRSRTVVDLFRETAQSCPAKTALVFQDQRISYGDLDRLSDQLARRLRAAGAAKDEKVALVDERGPAFVVGALAALKAGAAYVPLATDAPPARLAFQLADTAPVALLSSRQKRAPDTLFSGEWIDSATLFDLPCGETLSPLPPPGGRDMAYLIYTSGTTGQPKGVMIEHHSLTNLCHWFVAHYGITAEDRATAFAPFVFDASVWEIFPMLIRGATLYILDEDTRHDLPRLHDYLRKEEITVCYFLSQVAELIEGDSLPALRLMLSGGEVLHRAAPAGNYRHCNTYGPTEFTVTATSFDLDGTWPVPIGRPIANSWCLILDAEGRLQPLGVPGELCLSGEQLARGYQHRLELTERAFLPNPLALEDPIFGRMYRTGDRCRWLADGNIEFLGRLDQQVKLRGHRIELAEIEKVLQEASGAAQVVAAVGEDGAGVRQLCAYVVTTGKREDDAAAKLRAYAASRLPSYMIPTHVLFMDSLTIGTSGKVDRKALPPIVALPQRIFEPPATRAEKVLAEVWAEQLQVERVGRQDNFFELGGDSIKALMVTTRVRHKGYRMDARDFFRESTLSSLAAKLSPLTATADTEAPSTPLATAIPEEDRACLAGRYGDEIVQIHGLAPLQQGILFHARLHPESTAYLEQSLLEIRGPVDAAALRERLLSLVERHEMLRTAIVDRDLSHPRQVVLRRLPASANLFAWEDLRSVDEAAQKQRIRGRMAEIRERGFDLAHPPLLQVTLFRTAEEAHALLFTIHHIIADGWSTGVLFSELFAAAEKSDGELLQFRDYVRWLEGRDWKGALAYWRQLLAGAERSELPGRRLRGEEEAYRGESCPLDLAEETEQALREAAGRCRVTLNAVLQAAWGLVLSRCCLKKDLLFGEVVAGRPAELPGVEGMIGLCANTVPVRLRMSGEESFADLACRVQADAARAADHVFVSLGDIQAGLGKGGKELLSHFFVLENYPPPRAENGLQVAVAEEFSRTSFDFAVVWEQQERLAGRLVYNAAAFQPWQVESLGAAYRTVLEAVGRDCRAPLASLDLVPADQKRLLREFQGKSFPCPETTLVDLFRETASRQPEAVALICRGEALTYADLDRRSSALARRLQQAGAGPERIVALLLHRGIAYPTAALAVLKAGSAFLPLDADAPPERLRFQLEDAAVVALVSQTDLLEGLDTGGVPCLDALDPDLYESSTPGCPSPPPSPSQLAYVIYTSGTTGLPKGVLIEHRSLVNQCLWTIRHYGLTPASALTLFAAHSFDVSIWELFPGLAAGSVLHVLDDEIRHNLSELNTYIEKNGITDLWLPPHVAELFLKEHRPPGLRSLSAGGDVFRPVAVDGITLYNNYGPTEGTITATSCKGFSADLEGSIGKPVDNTEIHIFDRDGHLQPVGLPGELCIAGIQVARGYLNRPELTAAAFVANPFATGADNERLYRTGDLCRWRADGTIKFLGRLDQQVKIHGQRIEPGEIEKVLLAAPGVAQCVVAAREDEPGNKRLAAYVVAEPGANGSAADSLRSYLNGRLPPYMVPADILFLPVLPLTASGKIDRQALPAPEKQEALFVAPATPEEVALTEVLAELLGADRVGMNDDFFRLGGDSIKALLVVSRLGARGYRLELKDLYRRSRVAVLAAGMKPLTEAEGDVRGGDTWSDPLISAQDREHARRIYGAVDHIYRLTPLQEGMLFQQGLEGTQDPYLIDNWAEIRGSLSPETLRERLQWLAGRHEALRTVILGGEGQRPCQAVLPYREIPFHYEDLSQLEEEDRQARIGAARAALAAPRVERDPLLRVLLFRLDEERFRLLFSWHHIVLDGWSLGLLVSELFAAEFPAAPPVPFRRHVAWLAAQDGQAHVDWWRRVLADGAVSSSVPLPRRSPAGEGGSADLRRLYFSLDGATTQRLRTLAAERRLTVNSLLQAVWALLLSRYGDREEVLFANVVAGRPAALVGSDRIVGLCVSTLPVRAFCPGEVSLVRLAEEIQSWNLEAEEHAFCSPAELRKLAGEGFDLLFVFENQPPAVSGGDLQIVPGESLGYNGVDFALEWNDDGRLEAIIHYNALVYEPWLVEGLRDHYRRLIDGAAAAPDAPARSLDMLGAEERRRILVDANRTETAWGGPTTAVALFGDAARRFPGRTALVCGAERLSYRQVDEDSDALARRLRQKGAGAERIVGVLLPRCASFVVAVLAVMKAGAAYLPLDPAWPEERLAFVMDDAAIGILVDEPGLRHRGAAFRGVRIDVAAAGGGSLSEKLIPPEPGHLAYVIYTSGSTGRPKGVLVEHRGLANLCRWQHASFPFTGAEVCTSYAPWTFDASVYEIFPPLTCGATLHVLPEELRLDSEGLRDYFLEQGVAVAFLPPQVGRQLLADTDFPALRAVTLAGDKPGALAPRSFKLMNCYGPTEFTVCATSWPVTIPHNDPPIGTPIANSRCYVLDRQGHPQPLGVAGELCLAGMQTARGYLNRAEQTAERFVANPFAVEEADYRRLYRTGDRCRLMPDGNFYFLGRIDEQIKIGGRRLEPGEIEAALLQHPAVTEALVIPGAEDAASRLWAYLIAAERVAEEELSSWLRERLPHWMVPSAFLFLEEFPLTGNGKVDRKALPRPPRRLDDDFAMAPQTPAEKALAVVWQDVLGAGSVGRNDGFFALGGDSIKAMLVVSRLRAAGYRLDIKTLFRHVTLAAVAANLRRSSSGSPGDAAVPPAGRVPQGADQSLLTSRFSARLETVYGLTPMQEGLLHLHTLDPRSPAYIEQSLVSVEGELDPDRLCRRLRRAADRHPVLRTVFIWRETTQPWQAVLKDGGPAYRHEDLGNLDDDAQKRRLEERMAEVRRDGLDLEKGPLFDLTLFTLAPDRHALLISFHHIILDGWSIGLLAGELFGTQEREGSGVPFSRFVHWLEGQDKDAHRDFWRRYLDGVKITDLPGRKIPAGVPAPDYVRQSLPLPLDEELAGRLAGLAADRRVTLGTLLRTAWGVVLGRANNRNDAVFGAVLAGRSGAIDGLDEMVGLCVETVPVRVSWQADTLFSELLQRMQEEALALEAHAHLPLVDIQRLTPLGSALIRHLFVIENLPETGAGGAPALTLASGFNQTDYDLSLVIDQGEKPAASFHYNGAVLAAAQVKGLGDSLLTLLRRIAAEGDSLLSRLEIVSAEELRKVVAGFNDTDAGEPASTIVDLFRQTVIRYPRNIALVCGAQRYTYGELDAASDRLAARLCRLGTGADKVVAVLMERSADYVAALLGILKAGAAYLCLDPSWPPQRLRFLLQDAAPVAVVGDEALRPLAPGFSIPWLTLEECGEGAVAGSAAAPGLRDLAYVVYTSGTTGHPKGVMIEHRSLANFCTWHVRHYGLGPEDIAGHLFSFSFDASAWGIWPPLTAGGAIHILDHGTRTDVQGIRDYFDSQGITLANMPTVLCEQFLTLAPPRNLRLLTTGGDALHFFQPQPYAVYNEYGPSEATVMVTCHRVESMDGGIPIGRPIANTRCYILDGDDAPQPVGFPGELHIGGISLARGYINRPELTAAAFIPDPFAAEADNGDARLYRTGDLCRWLADGAIEFLGRVDEQMSLHGFRVEPGEIEQQLLAHPAVAAAAVALRQDPSGDDRLCAYLVGEGHHEEGIRNYLQARLPAHMVPTVFVFLDRLPLTSHGKLDRSALPQPVFEVTGGDAPPETAREMALAQIWQELLGVPRVGIDDDFFRIGGDSLKATRLTVRMERDLGLRLSTAQLMAGVTIRALARRRGAEEGPKWQPLVPLRSGPGTPLLLVHAVGGSLLCYRELVAALPKEQPVYLLPPYGMEEGQEPDLRLEETAARYVAPLLERFPGGDFLLVGLCMAGLTAWEIARQLVARGCAVRGVVSLNTRSHLLVDDQGRPVPVEDVPDEVPAEAIDIGLSTMSGYDGRAVGETDGQSRRSLRLMIRAQLLAWGRYCPPPLPLAMTCIRPLEAVDGAYLPFETRPLGWEGLALQGAVERFCPGHHFTMLQPPHVVELARILMETAVAAIPGSDSEALEEVPLTPIQRWFFGLPTRHGQFFQSVQLRSGRCRLPEVYRQILDAVAQRHEMLRAAYRPVNGKMVQLIRPFRVGCFGFRMCRCEDLEQAVNDVTQKLDLAQGPLAWCFLAPGSGDGEGDRLALVIHHLVVDGVSWRILQEDFSAALAAVDRGLPPALPSSLSAADGSFPAWARRLEEYAGGPARQGEVAFWKTLLAGLPPALPADFPVSTRRRKDLASATLRLDAELTRQLLGPCHIPFRTEINDLLLSALILAIREWRGVDAVTVDVEGHGRQELFADISPAAVVGWFTTVHPLALAVARDVSATIRRVRDRLRSIPGKGIGYGLIRYMTDISPWPEYVPDLLFNYLGDASSGEGKEAALRLERIGFDGDVADDFPQQAKLAVTGLVREGRLELTIDAHKDEFAGGSVEELLARIGSQLRQVADCCMKQRNDL